MTVRDRLRRSLPYAVAVMGGFLLAYLVVAFAVFPSGVVTGAAKVPDVAGLSFDEAGKRLAEVGLKAKRGAGPLHDNSTKGTVLDQDPRAGAHADEGAAVTLIVSSGQQVVAVPPIVGLTQADARTALEASGFELGQVVEQMSSEAPGQVLASTPASGTSVVIPSRVSIVISVGSNVALVPNVVGRSLADARDVLRSARLDVGSVAAPPGTPSDGGTVTAQSPIAGSRIATGSRITLQVGPAQGGRP